MKNVRNFRLFQPQPADKTLPAGQGHGLLPAHGPQQQRRPGVDHRRQGHRQQGGQTPGHNSFFVKYSHEVSNNILP